MTMANPPWEPYPERKRKLEERSKRPLKRRDRVRHSRAGGRKQSRGPAINSSFSGSTSSSCEGRLPTARRSDDTDAGSTYGPGKHDVPAEDTHFRVRPEGCWCLREGGCGDEDACCLEDLPGASKCPCFVRMKSVDVVETLPDLDTCNVCLEDGKLRPCCNRHYCMFCYESTGNCPGCFLITVGAKRGRLTIDAPEASAPGKLPDSVTTVLVREGEECRACLRQGFARKCCGEFYCSDCYFASGHCPSCQEFVERRIKYERFPRDPGLLPVLVGYLATLLVTFVVLACVGVWVASNESAIATIFGNKCYGFFPSCIAAPKCVEFAGNTSNGLQPITRWSSCQDTTTRDKIYGTYCIFDEAVFVYSGGKWGFDFCAEEFLSTSNGVYVFEDTFELWTARNVTSNTMASARWDHVTNGAISDICGVGAGDRTIMFSGNDYREAETLDVDMRFGGKLMFLFKMGPYTLDPTTVVCKPAYGGNVYLYYSLDEGNSWKELSILETYVYRSDSFSEVEVDVPISLGARSVRFKWKQENFRNALEYWALDNVQILSYFAEGWHSTEGFAESQDVESDTMKEIQCCLNSEQCELSRARQEEVDCAQYTAETSNERALMGAELFVVLAGLVALARSAYRAAEGMVLHGWDYVLPVSLRKKRPKIFMADDPVPGAMNKVFKLDVDPSWQARFLLLVGVPLAICWVYCAALLRDFFLVQELTILPHIRPTTFRLKAHVSGLFLLATFIDVHATFLLARDVICVLPVWVPSVDVDLRPSAGWVRIGQRQISLKDIKDTEMFSKRFCTWLAAGYVLGVMPWSIVALTLKYSYIPYSIARYVTITMGSVLLWRAWLGAEWVIKTGYLLQWLLTVNMYRRDDIGNAFMAAKTRHLVGYCATFGTLVTMGFVQLFDTRSFYIISGVALCLFAFYGLGLSVVQGLPITPIIKLTTINRGLMLRIHRRVVCPCERRLDHCGDMHSRDELLCIFVRDTLTFSEMLRGDDTI